MHHIDKIIPMSELMKSSQSIQTDPITEYLSENQLNTVEWLSDFYLKAYKREMSAYEIKESVVHETALNLPSDFKSTGTARCCYMYVYATSHTLLVKDCITRFLNEYSNSADLIDNWRSNLNISCLSFGPCLDCIAFNLAVLGYSKDPTVASSVSTMSHRSPEWLKTIHVLSRVLKEVKTPFKMKYVSHVTNMKKLLKPHRIHEWTFIPSSNVILVFQPFTCSVMNQCKNTIINLFDKLKSGTLIFSITPSSQSSAMRSIMKECRGSFLYGPVAFPSKIEVPGKPLKYVPSTTFEFFVWVKDFDPFASGQEESQLLMNIPNKGALRVPNSEDPPMKIQILIDGLKRVEMLYSFFVDDVLESNFRLTSKGTQTDLVSEAVLENKLNTNRLVTDFFMEVYKCEAKETNSEKSINLFSDVFELWLCRGNFDLPIARCAYVYYYATSHTLLIKHCITRFLTEHSKTEDLLAKWRSNPNYCSLSHGPGLDYIGFSLAMLEVTKKPIAITKARIVEIHNWDCTINSLSKVIQKVKTPLNLNFSIKFTQHQDYSDTWNPKTITFLTTSSAVFMFKTLNLGENETTINAPIIMREIVNLLTPGTLIFFMDSAKSSNVMREVLRYFPGTFLYGPILVVCKDLQVKVSEELLNTMKLLPAQSAAVEFFVWEKSLTTSTPAKNIQKSDQLSTNILASSKFRDKLVSVDDKRTIEISENVANNTFMSDASKSSIGLPDDLKGNYYYASTELSQGVIPPTETCPTKQILSGDYLDEVKLLVGDSVSSPPLQVSPISDSSYPINSTLEVHKLSMNSKTLSSSMVRTGLDSVNEKHLHHSSLVLDPKSSSDDNKITTIDTLTRIFMEVYEKEMKKFGKYFNLTTLFDISSTFNNSFNSTRFRCAYMYRYATCHTLLIKDCITKFLIECSNAEELLKSWQSNSNLCSLSFGPGLDYIAFSLAVLEYTKELFTFTQVNILTKCVGWRDTFNILSDVILVDKTLPDLNFFSPTFLKGSVFEKCGSQAVNCLLRANVLFMFKALDLDEREKNVDTFYLQELVSILNVGTVIFFIDTPYSSKIMQEVLSRHPGIYLYAPISVACNNIHIRIPRELKKVFGVFPVQSATADFFVWEKHSNTSAPSESHLNLKSFQIQPFDGCESSSKLLFPNTNKPSFYQKETSTDNAVPCLPFNSTESPQSLNWRAKENDLSNNLNSVTIKVENKNKILDHLSSRDSDIQVNFLSEHAITSDSGFRPSDRKQHNSTAKTNSVVSKTITTFKNQMESSNEYDSANFVENSYELAAHKPIKASNNEKITSEHHCLNSVVSEQPEMSDFPSEMGPTKQTLSNNQVDKINSLIARINKLASSIGKDLGAPSVMCVNECSVNVTEINLLTKRINDLVTTLESNIGNQHQSSKSRSHKSKCHCSCKIHLSPCQNNCDMNVKTSSSNCHIVPCQFLGHRVRASCVRQPSIVIPLKNITPDLLSLILSG